jgi:hypothetical protein
LALPDGAGLAGAVDGEEDAAGLAAGEAPEAPLADGEAGAALARASRCALTVVAMSLFGSSWTTRVHSRWTPAMSGGCWFR